MNCLIKPKSSDFGGIYQDFVAWELGQLLPKDDLLIALSWLKQQPTRRDLDYPFNYLSDAIILKAWEHLENPEILSEFAQIALVRLSQHDELIDANNIPFKQLLKENDFKRRQLLDAVISIIPESEQEPWWLAGYSQLTPLKQDFFWLIEKLQTSRFDHTQRIYSKLIRRKLDWHSADQINAVLAASQDNLTLRTEFAPKLEPILLESPEANQAKLEYIKSQESQDKQKVLNPSPTERILNCLKQLEAGSVYTWCDLCLVIYDNKRFQADVTKLPGWQDADEATRLRIIAAAKKYIYQGEPKTDDWLGKNEFLFSALHGYKALHLISVTEPNFISNISANVWQKWAASILSFPRPGEDQDRKIRQQLIKRAYQNAPDELIRVLIILIDQENARCVSIHHILREIKCCWDERLAEVLLDKVQDKQLKATNTADLLIELLAHRVNGAKAFAESLISLPLPTDGEAREKAIVGAQMLMLYSEDVGWSVVWNAIQQDPKFGREVLVLKYYDVHYEGNIEQWLKENYLADLYIFLARQYPTLDGQQKDSDNAELTRVEDYIPQRLQELGTQAACDALRKIIYELPELKDKLQWRLLEAEALVRRKTWQPLTPEQIFQLVDSQITNQNTPIQLGVLIMQGSNNPNLNFSGPVGAVNVNSTVHGDQIGTQHNYAPDQNLGEAYDEIQQIFNRLTQNYSTNTEDEKQIFVQQFDKEIKSNSRLRSILIEGGIELIKILCPPVGVPIEMWRKWLETAK